MDPYELEIGYKLFVKKQMDNKDTIKAEILSIKHNPLSFYVHYINYNKRLDEWVSPTSLKLDDIFSIEIPKKKKKTEDKTTRKSIITEKDEHTDISYKLKNVRTIQFDNFQLEAWYFSPYPKIIAEQPIIYICSFCLFYFGFEDQYKSHNCKIRHPPGNEIYRKNGLSFFELDGHVQKNYCRNLCLLSKLFLDHKTLYYDIDPFLFYILCKEEEDGFHFVGYFSKEKDSLQGYNVACLLTMPHCQRKGYGRVLIDFSYLLSRKEGLVASPEKPLSDLGLLSYRKYWKEKVFEYLSINRDMEISIAEISKATSITEEDIGAVLSEEGSIKFYDGEPCFILKDWMNEKEGVDETCLEWEPTVKANTEIK